jgi:hypothetical protein
LSPTLDGAYLIIADKASTPPEFSHNCLKKALVIFIRHVRQPD